MEGQTWKADGGNSEGKKERDGGWGGGGGGEATERSGGWAVTAWNTGFESSDEKSTWIVAGQRRVWIGVRQADGTDYIVMLSDLRLQSPRSAQKRCEGMSL